jgi:hypothetical protein
MKRAAEALKKEAERARAKGTRRGSQYAALLDAFEEGKRTLQGWNNKQAEMEKEGFQLRDTGDWDWEKKISTLDEVFELIAATDIVHVSLK